MINHVFTLILPAVLNSIKNKQTPLKQIHTPRGKRIQIPLLVWVIMLLSIGASYAAPANVDSLVRLTQKSGVQQKKLRILYLELSKAYHDNNSDSELYYARRAYSIQDIEAPEYIVKVYTQLGTAFYSAARYDSALYYYNKSLAVHKEYKMDSTIAHQYINVGNVYLRLSEHATAISYYDTAAHVAEKANVPTQRAVAINNLASIYYDKGAYSEALENYMNGLTIHEQENNTVDIEKSLLNIANVYFRLGDLAASKEYLERAQKLAEEHDSNWGIITILSTYGMIYNEEKKYDSSLRAMNEAYELSKQIKSPYLTNILLGNIAECQFNLGHYSKAFQLYEDNLQASKKLQDKEGIGFATAGLGQVYIKRGDIATGISLLKDALNTIQQTGNIEQAKAVTDTLAQTYKRLGQYKEAIRFIELKEAYDDTLAKDEALRTARKLEFEYQLGKKEAQIALLEKDAEIETAKTNQQRILLIAALIGLVLMVIIAILTYRNLRHVKERNAIIRAQKQEIEQQAEHLKQLNNFKDTTFSVLSHDLRSPINALTGTMAMLEEGIITPEEFAEHKNELNNKLQSVSLMLDNLLQWAKAQMKGEHTLDIEKINVRRKALRAIAVLKDAAEQKNITLQNNVPEELYAYADRNQVEMVLRNLVSNAVKFTPENGIVTINATEKGKMVAISVTDTGTGMSKAQAGRLFDGSPNASTAGTSGEKGTGIGLHLSYSFVQANGGDITVDSTEGEGTTFTMILHATPDNIA